MAATPLPYLVHVGQLSLKRVNVQSQVVENRLVVERLHELAHQGGRSVWGGTRSLVSNPVLPTPSLFFMHILAEDIVGWGFGVNGGLLDGGRWAMREPMITVL